MWGQSTSQSWHAHLKIEQRERLSMRVFATCLTFVQGLLMHSSETICTPHHLIHMLISLHQVKLAYRKAMLVVHPDKCAEATAEQKFIAKRVFEAVNEAYTTFAAAEMPS